MLPVTFDLLVNLIFVLLQNAQREVADEFCEAALKKYKETFREKSEKDFDCDCFVWAFANNCASSLCVIKPLHKL